CFFFQAEDGIRDATVTGVQTCALPIFTGLSGPVLGALDLSGPVPEPVVVTGYSADVISDKDPSARFALPIHVGTFAWFESGAVRSEERRVGKGCGAGAVWVWWRSLGLR